MTDDLYLRPGQLATVAQHLGEAMNEIAAWGVAVSRSRLQAMVELLRDASKAGKYPRDEAKLSLLSEAIRHAQEFVEITNALPKEVSPSLKSDLEKAVRGDLLPVTSATGPHLQFQTQLWVGAMLAQSQARVGVITRPGDSKNPDFILENGTLRYAVEVKRPNGELDAHNIVRKAARQIRNDKFHGGMIVVDLTDCLSVSDRFWCGIGAPDLTAANDQVSALLQKLHRQVFEDGPERLRNRRDHVFGIHAFARLAYWDTSDLAYPHLVRVVAAVRYWRRHENTLRGHRAQWLTDRIGHGITASGHQELVPSRPLKWNAGGSA